MRLTILYYFSGIYRCTIPESQVESWTPDKPHCPFKSPSFVFHHHDFCAKRCSGFALAFRVFVVAGLWKDHVFPSGPGRGPFGPLR